MKRENKLWLVKGEIIDPDMKSAMTKVGIICEIQQGVYSPEEDKQVGIKIIMKKRRMLTKRGKQ